jgi:hypothetical protein
MATPRFQETVHVSGDEPQLDPLADQQGFGRAFGRFVVSVERWSGGWDLHIDGTGLRGGGVTQVTDLGDADMQVRTYLTSVFGADFSHAVIDIDLPDVEGAS